MATTVARNQTDVNNMSARDRLWDSLNYSYGVKREESDKAYDRAISAQDRQLLSRGMQRSSYGMQTLANMRQEQVDTGNKIFDQQIADYENRLKDIEDTEWQQAFQEKQFNEGVRQFDTNLAYQKERAAVGDKQWQAQFDEGVRQYNTNLQYQQSRDAVADSQWEKQFAQATAGSKGSSGGNPKTPPANPNSNPSGANTVNALLEWIMGPSTPATPPQEKPAEKPKTATAAKNSGATTRYLMTK